VVAGARRHGLLLIVRLLFVTQRVDPDDPVLGATSAKIAALSARVDEVVVLADSAVAESLPVNCTAHSFASGSRIGRGVRFERALGRELARRPRPAAVIAHMCPIYAVLAAPLARPVGTRVMLWYAHWNRTRMLEAAVRVSNTVISVDTSSVPVTSAKVVGIGHGIDVSDFGCTSASSTDTVLLTALGRYSAAKGLDTIVRAVARARAMSVDVRLRAHGTSSHPGERENLARLHTLVRELELSAFVELGGPVPRTEVPALLAASTALVNNMRPGAPDKVVFEAAAACRPVLVSNPSFAELLDGLEPPLRFDVDDADELTARIRALAALGVEERNRIGHALRERVLEGHSVASWADAVVRLCSGGGS
jgi:glycosyltransferase involved in cell wall biosynthesis